MYHHTPCSRMRSILRLSKDIFWSQQQHMAAKRSWKEITYLEMMMIVRNYLNKNNISCTVSSTKYYKVTWVKTIVRKYAPTLDAESVWRDFDTHMSTSSKGLNERHRLHAYVSTTVYDRSWKGTNEQFVLHFHEQFRQLDELTPLKEQLPHSVRLTLLQTAVRSVCELRIVETWKNMCH